jgi:isoprenylcysteine carboxyl methyltransferase (ICMT) family protein YpbQ
MVQKAEGRDTQRRCRRELLFLAFLMSGTEYLKRCPISGHRNHAQSSISVCSSVKMQSAQSWMMCIICSVGIQWCLRVSILYMKHTVSKYPFLPPQYDVATQQDFKFVMECSGETTVLLSTSLWHPYHLINSSRRS